MPDQITIFGLLRCIRDARSTKNASRIVLTALALRCNPSKKFVCWPSYSMLADDTMLDVVTVKRVIRKLVQSELISKTRRPNRSSLYFINVPLLLKQAAEKQSESQQVDVPVDSPFGDVTLPADLDKGYLEGESEYPVATPDLDVPDSVPDVTLPIPCATFDALVDLVRGYWPNNEAFTDSYEEHYLRTELGKCIQVAGSIARCGQLISLGRIETSSLGEDTDELGYSLFKHMPEWLAKYEGYLNPIDCEAAV
jgi:hypothetical protein